MEVSALPAVINIDEEYENAVAQLQKEDEDEAAAAASNEHNNENVRKMISSLIFV